MNSGCISISIKCPPKAVPWYNAPVAEGEFGFEMERSSPRQPIQYSAPSQNRLASNSRSGLETYGFSRLRLDIRQNQGSTYHRPRFSAHLKDYCGPGMVDDYQVTRLSAAVPHPRSYLKNRGIRMDGKITPLPQECPPMHHDGVF